MIINTSVVVSIFTLFSLAQTAPDTCRQETWVPDATVGAVYSSGKTIYIGGDFSEVGPYTGGCVPFSLATGEIAAVFPKTNGNVQAICADGSGGWFIGGFFSSADGLTRNNIAHILQNGSVDPAWDADANAGVRSLVMNGSTLYAGGDFTVIGGQSRDYLAALNGQTGKATDWRVNANNSILCLASDGANIYAGGNFTEILFQERSYCIGVTAGWSPHLIWGTEPPSDPVDAIAVNGPIVYVGGSFTHINRANRGRLVALHASTGDTVSAFNAFGLATADAAVYSIVVNGSNLYVGGGFSRFGSESRRYLAQLSADSGKVLPWNPTANNQVWALAASGATVYAGGLFSAVGGESRNYIASIDATSGSVLAWNPRANKDVSAFAVAGTTLYAGGQFTSFGGRSRSRIAALDALTGKPISFNPLVNGNVNTFAQFDTVLYIGGSFTSIDGQSRKNLAALNAATGSVLEWNMDADGEVHSLAASGKTLYVAGAFKSLGSLNRSFIGAIDASAGNLTNWNPGADSAVRCIALCGGTIYVGGHFKNIGGQGRNYIAALDSATGSALAWNGNANNQVLGLVARGSTVYAAGRFTGMGNLARNYIAALDASSGAVMSFDPNANKAVYALALAGTTVYAGGLFDSIGGQSNSYIAALDGGNGTPLPWNPRASGTVYALAISGATLYAGGQFRSIGQGIGHSCFAQFGDFYPAPEILSITPPSGPDNAAVRITDLHGANFRGAAVTFVKAGQPSIRATSVTLVSAAQITCGVDLQGAAPGTWDIVVGNEDSKADTLAGGFIVTSGPPMLVSPANDAADASPTPTLVWHKLKNDSLYTLQVAASPEFVQPIINDNLIADTSIAIPKALLTTGTAYYWKVAATKKGGAVTDFCASWKFTTISLPGRVSLLSPSPAAVIQADSVIFLWNKPSIGADKYCLEVFSDSLQNGRVSIDSAITDTTRVNKDFPNKKSFWWRVAAHNTAGWGPGGEVRKIIVDIPIVSSMPAEFSCVVRGMSQSGSMIRYGLPAASFVSIRLYGMSGRVLKTVAQSQQAGYHRVSFGARDLPTGYFILDFRAGNFKTVKIISNL